MNINDGKNTRMRSSAGSEALWKLRKMYEKLKIEERNRKKNYGWQLDKVSHRADIQW